MLFRSLEYLDQNNVDVLRITDDDDVDDEEIILTDEDEVDVKISTCPYRRVSASKIPYVCI